MIGRARGVAAIGMAFALWAPAIAAESASAAPPAASGIATLARSSTVRSAVVSDLPTPVALVLSSRSGHTASSRVLTLTGSDLDGVGGVLVGSVVASNLTLIDTGQLAFTLGPAENFQPGTFPVTLLASDGVTTIPTTLTFRYRVLNAVDREMNFAFDNWNSRPAPGHGYIYIPNNDCANFASQVLRARGWSMTSRWYSHGGWALSRSWASSTALAHYIATHRALGTQLTDADRAKVRIGDIVQFDWDASGDRDHTGIISKIVTDPDGHIRLYYVAHTTHSTFASVDGSLSGSHAGGIVYYWRLKH